MRVAVVSDIHANLPALEAVMAVHEGRGELELSPEEDEAIKLALQEGQGRQPASGVAPTTR